MTTSEGTFPKIDADPYYASEYNSFVTIFSNTNAPYWAGGVSDGDLVFSSNTDLTKSKYWCDSLTINSGVTVTVPISIKKAIFFVEGDVNIEGILNATAGGVAGGKHTGNATTPGFSGSGCSRGIASGIQPSCVWCVSDRWDSGGHGGCMLSWGGRRTSESYNISRITDGSAHGNSLSITGTPFSLNELKDMMLNGLIIIGSGGSSVLSDRWSSSGPTGGASGGAIYIICKGKMTISGSVISNGGNGSNGRTNVSSQHGAGGGGAGGFIVLRSLGDMDLTGATITANGGNSGINTDSQGAGGGSGGFIGIACKGTYTAPTTLTVTKGTTEHVTAYFLAAEDGITYINGV